MRNEWIMASLYHGNPRRLSVPFVFPRNPYLISSVIIITVPLRCQVVNISWKCTSKLTGANCNVLGLGTSLLPLLLHCTCTEHRQKLRKHQLALVPYAQITAQAGMNYPAH